MALPQKVNAYISPEEFLEIRRASDYPVEYMDGEIYAMAGAAKEHGVIAANAVESVGAALRGSSCSRSIGISVAAPVSYLIPDLVVYCGGEFDKENVLQNPVAVFEVLSPSTEGFDHGPKWMRYQQIEALMHYVLISPWQPIVEVFTREAEHGWHYEAISGLDAVVTLRHLDIRLAMSDIYARVQFALAAV